MLFNTFLPIAAKAIEGVGSQAAVSVVIVVAIGALAGTISVLVGERGILVPAVALELVAGILIGPEVAGLHTTVALDFMSSLGLGLLFFFAGYEIDFARLKGQPLKLAVLGWLLSLAIAYTVGGALAWAGIIVSLLYTGSALATTAIGTLIPILSDSGTLKTRLGTNLLAAGAIGEFGPILLLSILLTRESRVREAITLTVFIAIAVVAAVIAARSRNVAVPVLERSVERSSQIAVRWFFLLVTALVLMAAYMGLDLLLGGFAAGIIARQLIGEREVKEFETKLTAVAFGVFVPFFFVVSGMKLDVSAIFGSVSGALKVPLFFALFFIVRGTPVLLLYRKALDKTERLALAFYSSTQLPLVLAITMTAVAAGQMRKTTASGLVFGALLSTLVFPVIGLRISAKAAAADPSPNIT